MLAPILFSLGLSLSSLGPEVPIGSAQMGNAALNQSIVSAASNGRDYLALWFDSRSPSLGAFYVGHVDASGRPVIATGRRLDAPMSGGSLTWTGDSYLFVYQGLNGFYQQALDDDGNAIAPATRIDLASTPREIASNGNSLLVLQTDGSVWLLAKDGTTLSKHLITWPNRFSPISVLPNGDYAFVTWDGTKPTQLNIVSATTFLLQQISLAEVGVPGDVNATTSDDGRIFVTWTGSAPNGDTAVRYEIVDAAGHALVAPSLAGTVPPAGGTISAGWDGHEFLIAAGLGPLRAWRVSANGQLASSQPIVLADDGEYARFARSANGVLVAWSSSGTQMDVFSRTASSFAMLDAAPTQVLAVSTQWQESPHLASGPTPLAVFNTFRDALRVGVPGSGRDAVLGPTDSSTTAVAARGRTSYLATWMTTNTTESTILAKRVAFDGTPIDSEPIVVAHGPWWPWQIVSAVPPSIAFDGTNFLIVIEVANSDLYGVRVSQSGQALDPQPFAIATDTAAIAKTVVWNGSAYVVTWIDQRYPFTGLTPPVPVAAKVTLTRVGADGHLLDASPRIVWQETPASYLGVASNGNELFVMFNSNTCIEALTLNNDGSVRQPVRQLTCDHGRLDIDVAWNGSEFVGVWSDAATHTIYAWRFDGTMYPLDPAPLAVSPPDTIASKPAIAASDGGATIAYIRFADEPQFGSVMRAFTRFVPRLGPALPRRRAVSF